MIGNLKGNAALLAAFSFNAHNGKPILDSTGAAADPNLQNAFVLLTCTTLALELVAVYVGRQLLYRMGDGNFAQVRDDDTNDPDRTILSILLSAKYKDQFYLVAAPSTLGLSRCCCHRRARMGVL